MSLPSFFLFEPLPFLLSGARKREREPLESSNDFFRIKIKNERERVLVGCAKFKKCFSPGIIKSPFIFRYSFQRRAFSYTEGGGGGGEKRKREKGGGG